MSTKTNSTKPAIQKSATITLRANEAVMTLVAERRDDGTARTYVTTRQPGAPTQRGCTTAHKTFEAAKAHLDTLAKSAVALGWSRGTFSVARKADAFSALPAPSAVAPKEAVAK